LARTTPIFLLAASIVEPEKRTLPDIYNKYFKVFSKKEAAILSLENINHKINLQPDIKGPPYRPFYPCSAKELKYLYIYLEEI
jgi:hypothetical protein